MTSSSRDSLRYLVSALGIALAYAVIYWVAPQESRGKALIILTIVVVVAVVGGFAAGKMLKRPPPSK